MANCEETPCVNVQSAICLHCSRRLCAPHIIAHGTALLKEGDELCEEINHLSEHLNFSLQKIHKAREEAMHKLGVWRQDQIDKIEFKFAEKTQAIEFRQDDLTHLENDLTQRLEKEAKEPLNLMQVKQNASSQALQLIRQNIAHITRDSAQLDLCLKELSSSIPNTIATNETHLSQYNLPQQEHASTTTKYYYNSNTSLIPNGNQWYPTTMNNFQPLINPSSNLHQISKQRGFFELRPDKKYFSRT